MRGEFDDFPVKFLTLARADAGAARNAGIDAAAGDYVLFLDADDEFLPAKLETVANAVRSGKGGGVLTHRGIRRRASGAQWHYPLKLLAPGEDLGKYFFSEGNFLSSSAIVARLDVARDIRFSERATKFDDTDFVIRTQAAGYPVHMLPQSLYVWHDEVAVGRMSRSRDHELHLAWARSLGPVPANRHLPRSAPGALRSMSFQEIFPSTSFACTEDGVRGGYRSHQRR